MAMINCLECEKEISDKATSCPNCGCPVSVNENKDEQPQSITTSSQEEDMKIKNS